MAITINHQTNDISATSGSMTIDGSSVGVDNTKMPLAGGTFTGDIIYGDNVKAKFGAGNDLTIHHDSSTNKSHITESGSSHLVIQGQEIQFDNAAGTSLLNMSASQIELLHGGSTKLTTESSGIAVTGNANFADNGKAIFGAGSDLEIYHGTDNHSYIKETGSGNLRIMGQNLRLQNASGADYLEGISGGAVNIMHNSNTKLATTSTGIAVTGSIHTVGGAGTNIGIQSTAGSHWRLGDGVGASDGTFVIYDYTNSVARMRFNSNGYADIASATDVRLTLGSQGTAGNNDANFVRGRDDDLMFNNGGGFTSWESNGSEQMRIDSSGNVLVGTTSTGATTASDGAYITPDGQLIGRATGIVSYLNRRGSDGAILSLMKDGASVGSLNCEGTNLAVSSAGEVRFITGGSNEDMRLETDGDLHVDGNVIAYSTTISDERLKEDIKPITGALDKVGQLSGYTFTYKADGKQSAGVIAQEVEKVLPSAVTESTLPLQTDDDVEYKTVQYDQLVGLLIESVKELKAEIEELKNGASK